MNSPWTPAQEDQLEREAIQAEGYMPPGDPRVLGNLGQGYGHPPVPKPWGGMF